MKISQLFSISVQFYSPYDKEFLLNIMKLNQR